LNLHDGEIWCNGRKKKITQRRRGRRDFAEQRKPRAQDIGMLAGPSILRVNRMPALPRFSCGFGWDKMAGEDLRDECTDTSGE
jgi:hypothetical protein